MTKTLTYVEIDIPAFTQNSPPNSPPDMQTFRFAVDAGYLPKEIDAIPSITDISIDPAILSLGENIGTRTTVTVKFRDHRHIMNGEHYSSGTFWGKFRARYGLTLRGYAFRLLIGKLGDTINSMETRNFTIDSTDGPSASGEFSIIAKDVLKFADGDRSQAPVPTTAFVAASMTNAQTTVLLNSGAGASFPASGMIAIGGSEICTYTGNSNSPPDLLTGLSRGQRNTTAVAHSTQERVQLVLQYVSQNPADIIRDLLVTYADVNPSFIDLASWQAEINTYINSVYTAYIAEPTDVSQLISELIEQVGLILWWDDIGEQIKLQVLRPIPSDANVFDATNYMADSLVVTEQPDKRLTQVFTYFAKINPLINDDQINNYQSSSFLEDIASEALYGTPVIKKIYSRWIPSGGRAIADLLNTVLIARFKNPPRRVAFDVLRNSVDNPVLGIGYQVGGWPFQNTDGTPAMVAGQITKLNPGPDIFQIEVEEISVNALAVNSPDNHLIIYDSSQNSVNLKSTHDSLYGPAVSGNTVTVTINPGVIIGSTTNGTSGIAFDVGTGWAAGVTIIITNKGTIQGKGGSGGSGAGVTGGTGGTALKTTIAISLDNDLGQIWGGGGGGGSGGEEIAAVGGCGGGGGGAGTQVGPGGAGLAGSNSTGGNGSNGTATTGGGGGAAGTPAGFGGAGGAGGGPGLNGAAGTTAGSGAAIAPGSGGAAGRAIDGISHVTFLAGVSPGNGDIRGPQVN